jgi:alginate O-acetyltransferase complex protein AlgI
MNLLTLENIPVAAALLGLYWLMPRRFQLSLIIFSSCAFFVYQELYATFFSLTLLTCGSYFFTNRIKIRTAVFINLLFIVCLFILYKLMLSDGEDIYFVLGASYYMLRLVHYLIESNHGNLPEHSFLDFVGYMFFLPTFFVGPINRFPEFVRDERRRRWDPKLFHIGLERILFGYFKVVVLANYLLDIKMGTYIASIGGDGSQLGAWMLCLEYGLDLYLRFGGYCDVAIGVSALFGFRIMENFNYPFIRENIGAFWQSWHISLSSWCRDYIFTPTALALRKPVVGVLVSMLVLGLWHEISLRYLAWGAYHGVGIIVFQTWSRLKTQYSIGGVMPGYITRPIAIAITFNFVILSFAITRTEDLSAAMTVYRTILGVN